MTTPSSIIIRYDGTDITTDVIFSSANFEQNTGGVPGSFSFRVKDMNRTHDFVVGKEVTLTIDGQKLFGGIVMIVNRMFAFPVVDTSSLAGVEERMWEISGSDYNIWFDKLVVRNPANYLLAIEIPAAMDGDIIRTWFDNYFDLPAGMDISTHVHNILWMKSASSTGKWAFPTQGTKWREVMEGMRTITGATYFIDADKKLHWHSVADIDMTWGLTDAPDNYDPTVMIGCRDVRVGQDGANMVTDALIWTGNAIYADSDAFQDDGGGLYFTRFPNPPANETSIEGEVVWNRKQEQQGIDKQAAWGRWQYAEQNFGEGNSARLGGIRARQLVIGPTGTIGDVDGGLGQPLWDIEAAWFGHQVPGGNHAVAGYMMDLIFHGLGTSGKPLVQYLPLRHTSISFPTIPENPSGNETYVKFIGRFGVSYTDHRKLWAMLNKRRKQLSAFIASSAATRYTEVDEADPDVNAIGPVPGAFAKLSAEPVPGDATGKLYMVGHAVIPATLRVYLNGLFQRPGIEYELSDATTGQITFYAALYPTDEVFIEFRAAGDVV